jgi:hypothetical protein
MCSWAHGFCNGPWGFCDEELAKNKQEINKLVSKHLKTQRSNPQHCSSTSEVQRMFATLHLGIPISQKLLDLIMGCEKI